MIEKLPKELIMLLIKNMEKSPTIVSPIMPEWEIKKGTRLYYGPEMITLKDASEYDVFCPKCVEITRNNQANCQKCGKPASVKYIFPSRCKKETEKMKSDENLAIPYFYGGNRSKTLHSRIPFFKTYYVRQMGVGIEMVRLTISIYTDEIGNMYVDDKYDKWITITKNEAKAYKKVKEHFEEVDLFENIPFSYNMIEECDPILFEGAASIDRKSVV